MSKEFVVGRNFPEFTLKASSGETIAEKSFLGKKTIVFIYPKNDTSGCTKECIDFSNLVSDFKEYNTTVFGLSKDTHESHKKFIEKHNLNICLIADPSVKLISALGAWVKKSMYGKEYMGSERTTFILDENNKVTHIYRKVKVKGHAEEVLKACKTMIKEDNG